MVPGSERKWRRAGRGLLLATGWLLGGAGASAETYQSLQGALEVPPDSPVSLEGWIELEPAVPAESPPTIHLVSDFRLRGGDHAFMPRQPIEYDGLTPHAYLEVANQLHLDGDQVAFFRLRSGGTLVAEDPDAVTFRIVEFRSGPEDGGVAVGLLDDGTLPRRLQLAGTLHQVDQRFLLPSGDCTPGDITSIDRGGVIVSWDEFDLDPDERAPFSPDAGGAVLIGRVTGGEVSAIEGTLEVSGSAGLVVPAPIAALAAASTGTPTLEDLGIVAPAGAELTFDADGGLTSPTRSRIASPIWTRRPTSSSSKSAAPSATSRACRFSRRSVSSRRTWAGRTACSSTSPWCPISPRRRS